MILPEVVHVIGPDGVTCSECGALLVASSQKPWPAGVRVKQWGGDPGSTWRAQEAAPNCTPAALARKRELDRRTFEQRIANRDRKVTDPTIRRQEDQLRRTYDAKQRAKADRLVREEEEARRAGLL